MGLPAASTMVDTVGTSPSRIRVDSWTTTPDARPANTPIPPTIGNINAAASKPASTQKCASLAYVASFAAGSMDMPPA